MKIVARGDTDIIIVLNLIRLESTSDIYLYRYKAIDKRYSKYILDVSFIYIYS